MDELNTLRKGPSRAECEKQIRRILITEILQNGSNRHFKKAADFIKYFESLYPASDSLNKQVQRAVKAMNMPKDDGGFFIIDRTPEQIKQDTLLTEILTTSHATTCDISACQPFFLEMDEVHVAYTMHLIENSGSFADKYTTMLPTKNGILFLTETPAKLSQVIDRLAGSTIQDSSEEE